MHVELWFVTKYLHNQVNYENEPINSLVSAGAKADLSQQEGSTVSIKNEKACLNHSS